MATANLYARSKIPSATDFCNRRYALNLFRKLVDSTRTIYNIPTAICSSMEMAIYYFGFTCYFLAVCLVGVGYQPSVCYLPAICLFRVDYLLIAYLFGLSDLSI